MRSRVCRALLSCLLSVVASATTSVESGAQQQPTQARGLLLNHTSTVLQSTPTRKGPRSCWQCSSTGCPVGQHVDFFMFHNWWNVGDFHPGPDCTNWGCADLHALYGGAEDDGDAVAEDPDETIDFVNELLRAHDLEGLASLIKRSPHVRLNSSREAVQVGSFVAGKIYLHAPVSHQEAGKLQVLLRSSN